MTPADQLTARREDRVLSVWSQPDDPLQDTAARLAHRHITRRGDRIAVADAEAIRAAVFIERYWWLRVRASREAGR